jgi:histone-lysine N-methyltransferase SETMAR
VHYEVLERGDSVNSTLYYQQLERVNQTLIRQGINPVKNRLLHDNARPHVSKMTQSKIEKLGWKVLPHAPYSPDLAPTDYHLFRSMEHSLREMPFDNVQEVKNWVGDYFKTQPEEFFSDGIQNLRGRWRKEIDANGEYFID